MATTKYRPGDQVIVPWGFGEARGTVVHSFGPAGARLVMVQVDIVETDEGVPPTEIGFKASDIRLASVEARS